jgi:predicted amidophosphoribosyltransferase
MVSDCLRWRRILRSSHLGGTRDPRELSRELVIVQPLPLHSGTAVLVDDLVASGAHLSAVSWVLASAGVQSDFALCVARVEAPGWLPFVIKQAWIPTCPNPRLRSPI